MKKNLEICTGKSCRSQMAQGILESMYTDHLIISAGSKPSGSINPKAIKLMSELGHELTGHYSKSVETVSEDIDYLITMGCGDSCPTLKAIKRIEWDIPDPKDMNEKDFKEVIVLIDQNVRHLIRNIT